MTLLQTLPTLIELQKYIGRMNALLEDPDLTCEMRTKLEKAILG